MAHVPTIVSLVLLVGLAALPVKPLHMLSLGTSIILTFLLLTRLMGRWDELMSPSGIHTALILVIAVVCTGLTDGYLQTTSRRFSSPAARRAVVRGAQADSGQVVGFRERGVSEVLGRCNESRAQYPPSVF